MKFYTIVIILAAILVVATTVIIRKNKSKDCGCRKKFVEEFGETEQAVERLG